MSYLDSRKGDLVIHVSWLVFAKSGSPACSILRIALQPFYTGYSCISGKKSCVLGSMLEMHSCRKVITCHVFYFHFLITFVAQPRLAHLSTVQISYPSFDQPAFLHLVFWIGYVVPFHLTLKRERHKFMKSKSKNLGLDSQYRQRWQRKMAGPKKSNSTFSSAQASSGRVATSTLTETSSGRPSTFKSTVANIQALFGEVKSLCSSSDGNQWGRDRRRSKYPAWSIIALLLVTVSPSLLGMQGRRSTRSSDLHTEVTQVQGHI